MSGFIALAIVTILGAVALIVVPLFRHPARAPVAGLVVALGIPAATALLYATLTSYPWAGMPVSGQLNPAGDPPAIAELRRQLTMQPNDAAAWLQLGQHYLAGERYSEAQNAFARVLSLNPQNNEAKLGAAEAAIMMDPVALRGEAGDLIEEVLAAQPDNPRALWYSGMAALGRGDARTVRERWQRLLALSPPAQIRQIIDAQLAQLPEAAPRVAAPGTTLTVRVRISPELAERVNTGAPMFLIARDPARPGPPVAVLRRDAASLPATLAITDADMMLPGQSLTGLTEIKLTARIANGGGTQARSGDLFGEAAWTPAAPQPLEILIDRTVP